MTHYKTLYYLTSTHLLLLVTFQTGVKINIIWLLINQNKYMSENIVKPILCIYYATES